MLALAEYLFQYGLVITACLMLAWTWLWARKHSISKNRWFRHLPLLFAGIMAGSAVYQPIVISSPKSGVIVHPGDTVPVTVVLHPAFLSALFPSVRVDLPRCWDCIEAPAGMSSQGALSGSPYVFYISIPKAQPQGVLATSASAAKAAGSKPAMRSPYVELNIQPK